MTEGEKKANRMTTTTRGWQSAFTASRTEIRESTSRSEVWCTKKVASDLAPIKKTKSKNEGVQVRGPSIQNV